jgi:hypothetical protein
VSTERILAWYRVGSSAGAVVALIVANLIPLIGVLFFGWSLITVMVLYWLENGIVGLWNIPRIALARGSDTVDGASNVAIDAANATLLLIPFFVIHYGIFWIGHGLFLAILPHFGGVLSMDAAAPVGGFMDPLTAFDGGALSAWGALDVSAVAFAGLVMLVSHGVSFFADYVRRREYLRISPRRQMFSVYGRVIVLHVTILFGGLAIAMLGSPVWILVVLVVAKTYLDLSLDRRRGTFATS